MLFNEPELEIADDDIVFESLSDSTLQLLHDFMFPGTVGTENDLSIVEYEPAIKTSAGVSSEQVLSNKTPNTVETAIGSIKRMPIFATRVSQMAFQFYQRIDGNFAIQLPQENDGRVDTIIISKDRLKSLLLEFNALSGINNTQYCFEAADSARGITFETASITEDCVGQTKSTPPRSGSVHELEPIEFPNESLVNASATNIMNETSCDGHTCDSDDADDEVRERFPLFVILQSKLKQCQFHPFRLHFCLLIFTDRDRIE